MPEPFVEVRGSRQLAALAARLKAEGRGDLRRELLRRIRSASKPALQDIPQSAYRTLPRRGGLAERVGKQAYSLRSRLAGASASVSITGRGMKELLDINRGRLRHPLFGNRDHWFGQQVEPGFFEDPIERRAPQIRREIEKAMTDVGRRVSRRL